MCLYSSNGEWKWMATLERATVSVFPLSLTHTHCIYGKHILPYTDLLQFFLYLLAARY